MCIFYFTLMQIIHYIAYLVIDDCNNKTNQLMSILNYYHICFQGPAWLIGWLGIFEKYSIIKPLYLKFMPLLIGMALITSILMALRRLNFIPLGAQTNENKEITRKHMVNEDINGSLQGKLCSRSGKEHIQFRVPLRTEPSYYTPNLYGHFFFFFIPFLFFNNTTRLLSLFTWVFGILIPTLYYNLESSEVATVWCFISIVQILMMYGYLIFSSKRH